MSIIKSLGKGLWRALTSPGLALGLWLVNVVVALPAAVVMSRSIESSLGSSQVYETMQEGFDMGWYGEFESRAKGLETTFTPTVLGAGAMYNNLEAWLSGGMFQWFSGIVGMGALYALIWTFLLGGVLERLGPSRGGSKRFFSAGGRFFFRFLRLAVLSAVLYYGVYRLGGWLFGWIESAIRDVTVEKTVLGYTVAGAVVVAFLLTFVNMAFDYAKIATYLEDRRSMIVAALRGFYFVLANPIKTFGLYYALAILGAALLGLYASVAPGAGQSTPMAIGAAFLVGQAYLLARIVLRLAFYGGQMALYEAAARAAESASEEDETGGDEV